MPTARTRRCSRDWRGSTCSRSTIWGLSALTDLHPHDLFEVLDDRDGTRSTVITSQLPREQWHDYLGDPTVADAILDRVIHRANALALTGPSPRKEAGTKSASAEA